MGTPRNDGFVTRARGATPAFQRYTTILKAGIHFSEPLSGEGVERGATGLTVLAL
jgi:hypothetical protein